MFYSHTYLKRNGRFGLIWLAATQSKVLTKRDLYAINVTMSCSDILEHIPGQIGNHVSQRPRRFSLYLTSQLMYGSAKVLQKQWEYLLTDVAALIRRVFPDVSSTAEIDLITARPEPVTLESCVPTSIKDKHYDPFFGAFKENTVDIESLLESWDSMYVAKCQLSPSQMPQFIQPEIGSPYSVSDPREIQIQDQEVLPIDPMLLGEQDLPMLDDHNLALFVNAEVPEELFSPHSTEISAATDITQIQDTHQPRPVEETPAVRTDHDMPSTPQKPKRKRRHDADGKKTKRKDMDTGDKGEEPTEAQPKTAAVDQQESVAIAAVSGDGDQLIPISPVPVDRLGHDWLNRKLSLELPPITSSPSPARKRRPHKLVIDEKVQMPRDEIKENMMTSNSTCSPMVWPELHKHNWIKDPGCKAFQNPAFGKLWQRNCKFGLRVYETDTHTDTDSSQSVLTPLSPVPAKRLREEQPEQTPQQGDKTLVDKSALSSVERGRDASSRFGSLHKEDRRSHSLVGPVSDDSLANTSAKTRRATSVSDHERSSQDGSVGPQLDQTFLSPWPEEQENMMSPVPLVPGAEMDTTVVGTLPEGEEAKVQETDTPRTQVLKMVHGKVQDTHEWTTFRAICPPSSTTRSDAAELFQALCCQVARGNLCVRQDEPYADIFIRLPDDRST